MVRRRMLDFAVGIPPLLPASRANRTVAALTTPLRSVHAVELSPGTPPTLSVTWDDGPDPVHTPGVLDELARAGARATFFVLVVAAEAHPELIRRMVAEGHEVGLHGIDHRRLSALSPAQAVRLVGEGRRRLARLVGRPVDLFRPPYGAQSPLQLLGTRAMGLQTVIWSSWASDWQEDDEPVIVSRALSSAHPGAILLLHDATGTADTHPEGIAPEFDRRAVARDVLAGLAERGLRSVPVGELLAAHRHVTTAWMEGPARGSRTAAWPLR